MGRDAAPRGWRRSALAILVFEIIEFLSIGSPPWIARDLQIFYVTLGLLIVTWSALPGCQAGLRGRSTSLSDVTRS